MSRDQKTSRACVHRSFHLTVVKHLYKYIGFVKVKVMHLKAKIFESVLYLKIMQHST